MRETWAKGTAFVVAAGVALLAGACAGAADDPELKGISGEELAVLKVVVDKICPAPCAVDKSTMAAGRLDPVMLLESGLGDLPEAMVADFVARNKERRALPAEISSGGKRGFPPAPGERKSCQLSRPGLDEQGGHALVLVKLIYAYPEDIMNEGKFVVLSLKDGKWAVDKTGQAWSMMLGL